VTFKIILLLQAFSKAIFRKYLQQFTRFKLYGTSRGLYTRDEPLVKHSSNGSGHPDVVKAEQILRTCENRKCIQGVYFSALIIFIHHIGRHRYKKSRLRQPITEQRMKIGAETHNIVNSNCQKQYDTVKQTVALLIQRVHKNAP